MIRTVGNTGNKFTNGANLHAEIAAAALGDEIVLTVGAEYTHGASQPFLLTNKGAGTTPIIIRTDNMALIPSGTRVGLADAAKLARCSTDDVFAVFEVATGAHHWTLQGLDITTTPRLFAEGLLSTSLIVHQDGTPSGPWPKNITYDRCLCRPLETAITQHFRGAQRGILAGGENITFVDSSFCEFGGWQSPLSHRSDGGMAVAGIDYRTWLVTGATNENPCVIQVNGVSGNNILPASGSLNKRPIAFEGAIGTGWSTLNATLCAEYVDSTHAKLQYYDPATGVKTNVDSSGWPPFATSGPAGGPQPMIRLTTSDVANVLNDASAYLDTVGPGPVTRTNCLFQASTYCMLTGGGGSYIPAQNITTVANAPAIDTVVLNDLGDLQVGDVISFETAVPQAISFASSTSPCRITVPTHRFIPTKRIGPAHHAVRIVGAAGAWAMLNGDWLGRAFDATHIDLYGDGVSNSSNESPLDTSALAAPTGSNLTSATWKPTGPLVTSGLIEYADVTPQTGKVTDINTGTKTVTYAFQGNAGLLFSNGNGAGVPVAVGSTAKHNGHGPGGYTDTHCTYSMDRFWFWLLRDRCKTVYASGAGPKGMWECKWASNVSVDGCIWEITGGPMGQDDTGFDMAGTHMVTFNQVDQNGTTPWVTVSNWSVRNCLVRNGADLFVGHIDELFSSDQSHDFLLENCLFTSAKGNSAAYTITMMKNLTIRHCTFRNGQTAFALLGQTVGNVIRDNIYCLGGNGYLYHADLSPYIGWEEGAGHVEKNCIVDNLGYGAGAWTGSKYSTDIYVASEAAMQFVDLAGGDAGGDYHKYALQATSPGHNAATDWTDCGVDFALLDAALAGETAEASPPPLSVPMTGLLILASLR